MQNASMMKHKLQPHICHFHQRNKIEQINVPKLKLNEDSYINNVVIVSRCIYSFIF